MKKIKNNIGMMKYIKANKFAVIAYVFLMAVSSVIDVFITLLLAQAIESITLAEYRKSIFTMLIVGGIYIVRRMIWVAIDFIYYKYSNKIIAQLNQDLAEQIFKFTSKTYAEYDTGTFVQRIIYDPANVMGRLTAIVDNVANILTTSIVLIYIVTLNVYIGIILVAVIIVATVIEYFRNKTLKKNIIITRKKGDKITSLTTEIVRSEQDIKALGLENALSKTSKFYYVDHQKQSTHTNITNMWFYSVRLALIELCGLGVLILGVYFVDLGTITLATFMIIYSNNNSLYRFVWGLGNIWSYITEIKASTQRMFSLFDEKFFACEHFGDVHLENINGKIEFKNVGFSYVEYEKIEKDDKKAKQNAERKVLSVTKVLQNLNFTIQPNTSVAFVGKSGSGKSTILNLVSKMYEVDEGEVLIDGVNIKSLDKPSLRGAISLVNQFPYIFDMTIKENLLLVKKDATDEEIAQALDKASLTEFVASLDKGVDTKVGESGVKLSGGQKQRLAIARAMLRNSPIIIFDESTSSLDNFAQGDIKHSIDEMKGKSTIIIVAHRLSTIKDVDKIFFLEDGQIIDTGTFDELFENNVKFKNMFYAENLN